MIKIEKIQIKNVNGHIFIFKKLSFLHFKTNLCGKTITKSLNIDLKIILKTFDGKKFKFKMAFKWFLQKFKVFKQFWKIFWGKCASAHENE